jgi:hypothetical protein
MKLPIIVYGASGAGASMLIWIIKRLRDTDYDVDDPLDNLGTAHNQPLLVHWFGNDKDFDAFKNEPEREQVVHAGLNSRTVKKLGDYCSFSIYFEDEDDVNQTAVLCYHKIPWFQEQFPNNTFDEIVKHLMHQNELSYLTYDNCCNISLKTMLYGPIEGLIELVGQHLNIDTQLSNNNYKLICNVVQKWREGNNQIFKKGTHGL